MPKVSTVQPLTVVPNAADEFAAAVERQLQNRREIVMQAAGEDGAEVIKSRRTLVTQFTQYSELAKTAAHSLTEFDKDPKHVEILQRVTDAEKSLAIVEHAAKYTRIATILRRDYPTFKPSAEGAAKTFALYCDANVELNAEMVRLHPKDGKPALRSKITGKLYTEIGTSLQTLFAL